MRVLLHPLRPSGMPALSTLGQLAGGRELGVGLAASTGPRPCHRVRADLSTSVAADAAWAVATSLNVAPGLLDVPGTRRMIELGPDVELSFDEEPTATGSGGQTWVGCNSLSLMEPLIPAAISVGSFPTRTLWRQLGEASTVVARLSLSQVGGAATGAQGRWPRQLGLGS